MVDEQSFLDWLIKILLAAAFGTWAWVVRDFGKQHVTSMHELSVAVNKIADRLGRVEIDLAYLKGRLESEKEEE